MKEIVKLSSPQYADKNILPQNIILSDYIDWDSRQSFDDFCNTSNIKFISNDFCIKAESEALDRLKKNGKIDLSELEAIGWFDKATNAVKWSNFIQFSPNAFNKLNVTQSSFSQFKKTIRSATELNIIKGGFLLSWYYNQEEYENFFSKIEWKSNDKWVIDLRTLDNKDLQIISQLFIISNNKGEVSDVGQHKTSDMIDLIANSIQHEDNDKLDKIKKNFLLSQKVIDLTFQYLVNDVVQLEKEDYINFLISKRDSFKDEKFIKELSDLYKLHIEQIRIDKFQHPVIKRLDRILSVHSSSIEEIKSDLKDFKKAELFIIGMIRTGSKIQESFPSNSIAYFSLEVIADYLLDIQPRVSEHIINIKFESSVADRDPGNKFGFLRDSFEMFAIKKKLSPYLKELKKETKDLGQEILQEQRSRESVRLQLSRLKKEIKKIADERDLMLMTLDVAKKEGKFTDYRIASDSLDKTGDLKQFESDINSAFKEKESRNKFCEQFETIERRELEKTKTGDYKLSNKKTIIEFTKDSEEKKSIEIEKASPNKKEKKPSLTEKTMSSVGGRKDSKQQKMNFGEETVDIQLYKDDPSSIDKMPKDKAEEYLKKNPESKKV